jgi:hypothetical protein
MEFEKNTVKNGENITKFEQILSFLSLVVISKINNRVKRFFCNTLSLCYIVLKYFVSPEMVKSGTCLVQFHSKLLFKMSQNITETGFFNNTEVQTSSFWIIISFFSRFLPQFCSNCAKF